MLVVKGQGHRNLTYLCCFLMLYLIKALKELFSDWAEATCTLGWTDIDLVDKGQGHCDLTKYVFDYYY